MTTRRAPPPPIGFPLRFVPDAAGELRFPTLETSVRQAIEAILRTRPGEQLARPDFGAGLAELLHEPNTAATRRRVQDLVTASLQRWEPRIDLDRVDVIEVPGEPSRLRVEIAYRLRATQAPQEIGLSMDLGG